MPFHFAITHIGCMIAIKECTSLAIVIGIAVTATVLLVVGSVLSTQNGQQACLSIITCSVVAYKVQKFHHLMVLVDRLASRIQSG